MKKIFALLTIPLFLFGCVLKIQPKEKENIEVFNIPNLDAIYDRIVKKYGEKGDFEPATNSYSFFKGDPKTPFCHVFYYPNEKKVDIAIFDRLPNGQIYSQEIIFFKGNQYIPVEYVTFGIYREEEKKYVPIKATQEKVEMLLSSF